MKKTMIEKLADNYAVVRLVRDLDYAPRVQYWLQERGPGEDRFWTWGTATTIEDGAAQIAERIRRHNANDWTDN